jgi:hypothetical protein
VHQAGERDRHHVDAVFEEAGDVGHDVVVARTPGSPDVRGGASPS